MNYRPILKILRGKTDKILDASSLVMLVAVVLFSIYSWYKLPAIVPVHFNGLGNPDSYGKKEILLLLPGIAFVLYIFLSYLNEHPHWFNYTVKITEENALQHYTAATRMMRILKLSVMIIFFIVVVCSYLAGLGIISKLPVWLLPVSILFAIGPVLFYLISSFKKG